MTNLPRPAVSPAQPWEFPIPTETVLDNGLHVLAYDLPGQYVLSVRLAVPLPLSREPFQLEGVGTIMARTLDEGTAAHDSQAFAELMERRGVAIDAGLGEAGLVVSLDVAQPELDYGLDLLRQCLTEPVFPDSQVARQVKTRLAEIDHERAAPASRAALEFIKTYYDSTERAGRPTAGSRETVGAITAEDVRSFHALEVGPSAATVVIAGSLGGIDPAASLDVALGGWTGGREVTVDLRGVAARRAQDAARIVFVDRPGSVQTEIYVGTPGPDRTVDGGWAPFPAAAFAIGGSPTARIDAVLREDKGYTYGIRSGFRPRRRGGVFLTAGSVRADATVESVDLLLGILSGAREGFSEEEIRGASDFLARTAPARYATADAVADEAAGFALEGLTTEFTTQLLADLPRLTPDRVGAAYRRFVEESWTITLVGDASAYAEGVRALGRGELTVVPA